jgi:ligand-binding sensor domain-containing protein/serine phosphatase RsbU (regulator of sigma subunit)
MNRNIIQTVFLISGIFLFSCSQKKEQERPNTFAPKVVETKGYLVPKDSVTEPKVIPCGNATIVKAGNPKVVPTNTNIVLAGKPKIILERKARVITPGKDTFLLPKTIPAIDSPFAAGIPEVVIAKDAYVKDQNPEGFSSFSKLQGLKHDVIGCMLQDKSGNLWFGTYGGGVSKYDGKSFTHFTEKEGLSNNTVLSMLEDKSGNLWFGTNGGGVSKYDGKSFTHFTKKEGLSNNTVLSMLEDKSGNLWFGTYGGGVSKYDGKSFTHFTEKEGLSNNTVLLILEDKSGILWFGTNGGVSKYNGKSFTHFTEKEGLSNNTVWSILEDKSGNLWFGTNGGVSKYNGKSFTHFTEKEGLSNNTVRSILEDKSGNLWFGTYGGGVSKYDGKSFTHFTEKEGLSNNTVLSILEDKSGNLWFGTYGGGVSKYDGKSFTHFTEKEGLSNNTVLSILEDKSGILWFGTYGGVVKYDGESFTHFTEKEGLSNNTVRSILEDKSGILWFGTNGGVSKYDGKSFTHFTEKEGLSNNTVWSILEDKSGNLWFGTNGGGVSKYDGKSFTHFTEKEGLSNNNVYSILEDKSGNLWFGTNGGVSKYDGKSFTHFTEKEGLSNNTVLSILEDKSGILWFGTYGGVVKYDGESFTHFTEKEGLSNNTVYSILEDKSGNLWFGTRFGLSKLTPENKEKLVFFSDNINASKEAEGKIFFKNYTYEDGFLGIGVNGGKTICEDKNGTIWVAANDRLTAYHPEGEIADTVAPNIQLTSIALFNENISWVNLEKKKDSTLTLGNGVSVGGFEFDGITKWYSLPENLSLAYNNNYLTFNFIGITQKQSKKVKYQYKLEGIDENWSAITNRTEAPYGNLPEGKYSFKVKAMNSEGYWSEKFNFTFSIRPPWWKTWLFRAIYITLSIISLYLIYRWRTASLRKQKEVLEKTVEERTEELVQKNIIVEEKHKEITDSINYAERIQRSFLATKELLNDNLKDHFVFFQPKDVVSGDFYWAAKLSNGNFALSTADSTGHGVPGAIMSILNISCLENSIKDGLLEPNEILNNTRKDIIERLKKDGSAEGGKDGMDCSLVSFDFVNNKLIYAAANNPIWIVRESQMLEFAPDKMPVGKHDKDSTPFTQHVVALQKDDVVYALTDGMPDQFGGPKGKKFMYKQLKELLISISHLPMQEQNETLNSALNNWKGNLEQVDDICLIGIRV